MRTPILLLTFLTTAVAALAQPSRPIGPPPAGQPQPSPRMPAAMLAAPAQPGAAIETPAGASRAEREAAMIAEICEAADRVAEKYHNLPYCHIITNDPRKADTLRERVAAMGSVNKLRREEEQLMAKCAELRTQVGDLEARKDALETSLVKQEETLRTAYNALIGLRQEVEAAGGEGEQ